MTDRKNISSGAKWEDIVGYSRAVRIGSTIEISGTTSVDGDVVKGKGDAYVQAKCILQKLEKTLHELGASLGDTVRTRMFVTDIGRWEEVGKAHGEFFGEVRPCTTMVEVSRLIHDDMLVEIELTAVIR
jgi:enamine deaminase RidA (YjgF/YER057c/UK114 family)